MITLVCLLLNAVLNSNWSGKGELQFHREGNIFK